MYKNKHSKIYHLLLVASMSIVLSGSSCSSSGTSINDKVYIKTKDTKLYADIRGDNRNAPILLYLHGGPANPLGILTFMAYAGPKLENDFVVIYLHQRGIMKSAVVPNNAHTLKNYVSDTHYVVQYLKIRFTDRDIYLFGHSWGGVLAYLYLIQHEGDIKKLVTACAPFNVNEIMQARYEMTLDWAKESENEEAITELSDLNISNIAKDPELFKTMSEWSSKAYGGMMRNISRERIDNAIDDNHLVGKWLKESRPIGDIMYKELMNVDLLENARELKTPLLVIAGKYDVDSPWKILKENIEHLYSDGIHLTPVSARVSV